MAIKLTVTRTDEASPPKEVEFDGRLPIAIGTEKSFDLPLERLPGVSRRHATIFPEEDSFTVVDTSRYGTSMDGRRLVQNKHTAPKTADRAKIDVGPFTIRIEVIDAPEPPPEKPTSADPIESPQSRCDAPAEARDLLAELSRAYMLCRHENVEERRDAIRRALEPRLSRSGLEDHSPTVLREVLDRLTPLPEPDGPEPPAPPEPEPEPEPPPLSGAAADAWVALAERLVGDATLESPEQLQRLAALVGQAMDSFSSWLYKSLGARLKVQGKFDVPVSILFGVKDNPIKLAKSPEEIRRYLLDWTSEHEPEQIHSQLELAMRDVTLHQFAVLRGVWECLDPLVREFDPAEICARAAKKSPIRVLLSRWVLWASPVWREYRRSHQQLSAKRLFYTKIYPLFQKAYEQTHEKGLSAEDLPDALVTDRQREQENVNEVGS
ncbi:MAG: type VI secretion system-associated FHA domain protein [Planctomycetota bacterium]